MKKYSRKPSVWGKQNWIAWLFAAATAQFLLFVLLMSGMLLYLRWQDQLNIGALIPTPEPTQTRALLVDGPEYASKGVLLLPESGGIAHSGAVQAVNVAETITIDGDMRDWIDIPVTTSAYSVYAVPDWDRSNDIDAYWRLAWDARYLYVSIVVIDDTHVQQRDDDQIYKGDSVELQIDTDRNRDYGGGLNEDDYTLTLSPGNFDEVRPTAYRFRGNQDGSLIGMTGHAIVLKAVQTGNGYAIEAAIPWRDLGVTPVAGVVMGIALNVNDNDRPNTVRQEVLKSHVATRTFADPNTWGTMILAGNGY